MSPQLQDNPHVMCITREQALSPHVDDILHRQASLRGEAGISRSQRGKWYHQKWFTFMLAGMIAAAAAWAILEPYFDDFLYIQGPIEDLSARLFRPPLQRVPGRDAPELEIEVEGPIRVNGQDLYVAPGYTKFLFTDGRTMLADVAALTPGQDVGLYVDRQTLRWGVDIAGYIVPDPAPNPPKKAKMPLEALAAQSSAAGMILFALVAAMVGLAIGATDGLSCRLFRRAVLAGGTGLIVGFIGGFVSSRLADVVYAPLNALAMRQEGDSAAGLTTFGFLVQMMGRSLGWCMAGMAMGLGQGIALRSSRLLVYGFLGGIVGGLLGGLLFDPIDLVLLGIDKPSAHVSRLVGIVVVGGAVGAMIGVVELLARDAWLRMVEGPLAGKEFLLFRDVMHLGSSPRSELYLFNDPRVAAQHAVIRSVGGNYEIENLCKEEPLRINGTPIARTRLRHGDQIAVGRTVFVFQKRKG